MPNLDKIVASFIQARYSAWAGDLDHCRELLDWVKSLSELSASQSHRWDSLGLILRSADQLRERLDADTSFLSSDVNASQDQLVPDETLLISTEHLRAVIHRIGDFDFELRGYLDDLDWESNLYRRASIVAERYGSLRERVGSFRRRTLAARGKSATRNPSSTWRIVGNDLLRVVSVGPFCLIKVKATWTRMDPPGDFGEIKILLENVLWEIERGELPVKNLVESQQ